MHGLRVIGDVMVISPSSGPPPPPAEHMPTLRVIAGPDMLKFVSIASDEQAIIGRDEAAELPLSEQTVSKRHARAISDGNGQITVIDLNSTNGTQINGQSITRAVLHPGDHLEVGAVLLRLDVLSPDELGHLGRVVKRLQQSHREPLTGLLTRAYIDDKLPQMVNRYERLKQPIACAFIDVDDFQSINDKFGHKAADQVVRSIARLLMLGASDKNPCIRYGDEEIMMFLPGNTELGAFDVAERMRCEIVGHDWARTARGLQVTASFGVSEREPDEPIAKWIDRAQRAQLEAKGAGRNRVARASSLEEGSAPTPA
jgi:two-component system cell cycle response regulator